MRRIGNFVSRSNFRQMLRGLSIRPENTAIQVYTYTAIVRRVGWTAYDERMTIQHNISSYMILSYTMTSACECLGATRVSRRRVRRGGVEKGTGRPATGQWRPSSRDPRSRRPPIAGPPAQSFDLRGTYYSIMCECRTLRSRNPSSYKPKHVRDAIYRIYLHKIYYSIIGNRY